MKMTDTVPVKRRKKRCDRNHIVYELKIGKRVYIGITHVSTTPAKALARRWRKHVNRAKNENKNWILCNAIRKHGAEKFEKRIIKIIRGKDAAHKFERALIRDINPALNSDKR